MRERLRGQLMLALYRSGRQAEALAAYQAARSALVEELGIEPGPALQELERAMLRQDPSLDLASEPPAPERSILVAVRAEDNLDALVALAELLARTRPARESDPRPADGAGGDGRCGGAPQPPARRARRAEESPREPWRSRPAEPGDDLVRLASEQDTDLLLVDCELDGDALEDDLATVLERAPCDVALLIRQGRRRARRPAPIARCWCRSAAPSTTGRRSRSVRGSRARAGPRCCSPEPKAIRGWGSETPAGCSRAPPCWCSGPSGSRPSRCSCPAGPRASSARPTTAGLDRQRTVRQVARRKVSARPVSPSPGTPAARPCSSGGACARGAGAAREPHPLHLVDPAASASLER